MHYCHARIFCAIYFVILQDLTLYAIAYPPLFVKWLTYRTPVDRSAQIGSLLYIRTADGTWFSNRVFTEKRSVSAHAAEQVLFGVAPA